MGSKGRRPDLVNESVVSGKYRYHWLIGAGCFAAACTIRRFNDDSHSGFLTLSAHVHGYTAPRCIRPTYRCIVNNAIP